MKQHYRHADDTNCVQLEGIARISAAGLSVLLINECHNSILSSVGAAYDICNYITKRIKHSKTGGNILISRRKLSNIKKKHSNAEEEIF